MKIRNGFVSNSSSSSFIVIGKRVNPSDLKIGDFVIGKYMNEGQDAFTITNKEMLDFVFEYSDYFRHFFTNARLINESSDDTKIDARDVGNEIFAFTKDYCGSDDIKSLKENYIGEE